MKKSTVRAYFVTTNSLSILGVEKLHLCSWLFQDGAEYLEVGAKVKIDPDAIEVGEAWELDLWLSFVDEGCNQHKCLYCKLKDADNARFIFNEGVQAPTSFSDGSQDSGVIMPFKSGESLCFLPIASCTCSRGKIHLVVNRPSDSGVAELGDNFYVRFVIELKASTFSSIIKGIARKSYVYDIKVNEFRNLPEGIDSTKILPIDHLFCIHIVPRDYQLAHFGKAFRHIRILEDEDYAKYAEGTLLPNKINSDEFVVVFNKVDNSEDKADNLVVNNNVDPSSVSSTAFAAQNNNNVLTPKISFTVFESESIGRVQVIFAMGLNLIYSTFLYFLGKLGAERMQLNPIGIRGLILLGCGLGILGAFFLCKKYFSWGAIIAFWFFLGFLLAVDVLWVAKIF